MFNLKMFDAVTYTAEQGKDIIILLRPLNKATAQAAALVPFGTSDTQYCRSGWNDLSRRP